MEGVFPLVPTLDAVGPMARTVGDVALMWSVLTGRPTPEPRLAGLTVGLMTRPPSVGGGRRPAKSLAGEVFVAGLEALGARVVPAEIPEPDGNSWPASFTTSWTCAFRSRPSCARQPARLGGPRDRKHAARRALRRDGAHRRARVGGSPRPASAARARGGSVKP
jgi:Asp-tRNA(Asn)/Glu-tRNA(Gln) amidotransferase A subunit family amidase